MSGGHIQMSHPERRVVPAQCRLVQAAADPGAGLIPGPQRAVSWGRQDFPAEGRVI